MKSDLGKPGRDPVMEVIGKMPFAGRHAIRWAYLHGREGAKTGNRRKQFVGLAILGAMVVGHALQAKSGMHAATENLAEGTLLDKAQAAYDMVYVAANVLVSYTQLRLFGKLAITREVAPVTPDGWRVALPEERAPSIAEAGDATSFTAKNLPADFAFTLGAQVLFGMTQPM